MTLMQGTEARHIDNEKFAANLPANNRQKLTCVLVSHINFVFNNKEDYTGPEFSTICMPQEKSENSLKPYIRGRGTAIIVTAKEITVYYFFLDVAIIPFFALGLKLSSSPSYANTQTHTHSHKYTQYKTGTKANPKTHTENLTHFAKNSVSAFKWGCCRIIFAQL